MVKESNVELREGTQALMEDCFKRKVPVLVLSAGLGVSLFLKSIIKYSGNTRKS